MSKIDHLALMLECFPASQVTQSMNATFLEAIQSVPLEAVKRCCEDFRHGRVERKQHTYIPSTAEFSKHLRVCHHEGLKLQRDKLTVVEDKRSEISEDERARVAEKFAYLKKHGLEATAKKYGIGDSK